MTTFTMRGADDENEDRSLLAVNGALITSSGTPDEAQFEDIRSRFGDPRANVKPDDYFVFRMIASGDGLDSYFTRQDLHTSFPNFVKDLHKGQSVLGSHQMATFSYGSSYNGIVQPAEVDRFEYESTFYPQWDAPDLRTSNWLVGDYFIGRDVEVNGQKTNDLIRSIELGNVRKTSISFMVGEYVCGLDNRSLIPTMFGPMPDEECNHFPGIAYDDGKGAKQIAWALMKHNTLVETSLVYKNASPSSMLLRKAETLASSGQLDARDINKLENRFAIRLPRFQPTLFPVGTPTTTATSGAANVRFDANVQEDDEMPNRRKGGNEAAREFVREALTADPEPEEETTEEVSEAPVSADLISEAAPEPEPDAEVTEDADASEAETEEVVSDSADANEEAVEEPAAADESAEAEVAEVVSESPEPAVAEAAETGNVDSEEVEAETTENTIETTSESTNEEDAVAAFVAAADRLANTLARNPDAFETGLLAMAARAEKGVDLALADAGCDATVGSQVYRQFEIRSKKLSETLGEPLTVEAIRSLQGKAQLGDELYAELVKDAVAARVTAQGDTFNADRYREVLLRERDVAYVKDEIASYKSAKREAFTPGRQVVPRQPIDTKPSKDERKTLPEAPVAVAAGKPKSEAPSSSLITPRKKS